LGKCPEVLQRRVEPKDVLIGHLNKILIAIMSAYLHIDIVSYFKKMRGWLYQISG
jgi:hypothetical protein